MVREKFYEALDVTMFTVQAMMPVAIMYMFIAS